MNGDELEEVGSWVTQAGLTGAPEGDLLRGFCKRLRQAGLPVARALVVMDTLHPVHEGRIFRWRSDQAAETEMREYGRTTRGGETAENWRRSPFYGMLQTGRSVLRKRLSCSASGSRITASPNTRSSTRSGRRARPSTWR